MKRIQIIEKGKSHVAGIWYSSVTFFNVSSILNETDSSLDHVMTPGTTSMITLKTIRIGLWNGGKKRETKDIEIRLRCIWLVRCQNFIIITIIIITTNKQRAKNKSSNDNNNDINNNNHNNHHHLLDGHYLQWRYMT